MSNLLGTKIRTTMAVAGEDVLFTVTGEGAQDLQQRLTNKGLPLTPADNGGFTVSRNSLETESAQDDIALSAIKKVLYKQAGFKPGTSPSR